MQFDIFNLFDAPITSGIYSISFYNSKTGRKYIGSAIQNSTKKKTNYIGFRRRWGYHLWQLKNNKHHSIKLQRAFNKYGENNIFFEVLEECDADQCIKREQFYIDKFNSYLNGYNSRPKAENQFGLKHSEECRKKIERFYKNKRAAISKDIIEKYLSGIPIRQISKLLKISPTRLSKIIKENSSLELKSRGEYIKKKIYQYSYETGELIKQWDSAYDCAKTLEITESSIRRVLHGKVKSYKNFYFTYYFETSEYILEEIKKLRQIQRERRSMAAKKAITEERRKEIAHNLCGNNNRGRIKNIKQLDLNGNLIKIWEDSKEISLFYNLKNASSILRVLRGERKKFKNCFWKLAEKEVDEEDKK